MAVTLIDYIPFYYSSLSKAPAPPVITGKFVQIRNGDTLYLVFSPGELSKYHANIVERFCNDKGLEGSYDSERKRYDMSDHDWIVAGGGKFAIDRMQKTIKLYDDSMAYGKFDTKKLKDAIKSLREFSDFTILIE
ncbi:MAG TPA: hypothetical protein VL122_01280 [Nitrospirota bacterium]|nr:hypothetical protein [Nitrospirota bacterium]